MEPRLPRVWGGSYAAALPHLQGKVWQNLEKRCGIGEPCIQWIFHRPDAWMTVCLFVQSHSMSSAHWNGECGHKEAAAMLKDMLQLASVMDAMEDLQT